METYELRKIIRLIESEGLTYHLTIPFLTNLNIPIISVVCCCLNVFFPHHSTTGFDIRRPRAPWCQIAGWNVMQWNSSISKLPYSCPLLAGLADIFVLVNLTFFSFLFVGQLPDVIFRITRTQLSQPKIYFLSLKSIMARLNWFGRLQI